LEKYCSLGDMRAQINCRAKSVKDFETTNRRCRYGFRNS
jgi:hypothetical protein